MTAPLLPLVVAADELAARLGAAGLVVVDLSDEPVHRRHHLPGATHLAYARLVAPRPPAMGMLLDDDALGAALGGAGIGPGDHVVACDADGGGKASRLLWTLDVVGHQGVSLLDGGLQAWLAGGHPVEEGLRPPPTARYPVAGRGEAVADRDYILARLGDPGVVILDSRTPAEYAGRDVRAARGGHIPGAVNFDWTLAMDPARGRCLRPAAVLTAALARLGVTPDKEVIVHCQTHHRSSHTYIVLKWLGFPRVRGYPGSWSEWGNDPALPVET
ncbi:MAG: sulfurtransferase [Proteobacteria bacterium]|nr:sulfurtransferase [Pseudomonadota bacterium]